MSRRKETAIPAEILDQLLSGTDAATAPHQGATDWRSYALLNIYIYVYNSGVRKLMEPPNANRHATVSSAHRSGLEQSL